jgi:5-methylcytosine-specific restriction endonuclease McrA
LTREDRPGSREVLDTNNLEELVGRPSLESFLGLPSRVGVEPGRRATHEGLLEIAMPKARSIYQDPRWQKKRLEILNRDRFTCTFCGDNTKPLHVHHRWYESGRKPWEYPNEALVTYCEDCHSQMTAINRSIREKLKMLNDYGLERVLGYLNGIFLQSEEDVVVQVQFRSGEDIGGIADALGPWVVTENAIVSLITPEGTISGRALMQLRAKSIRRSWAVDGRVKA